MLEHERLWKLSISFAEEVSGFIMVNKHNYLTATNISSEMQSEILSANSTLVWVRHNSFAKDSSVKKPVTVTHSNEDQELWKLLPLKNLFSRPLHKIIFYNIDLRTFDRFYKKDDSHSLINVVYQKIFNSKKALQWKPL